MVGRVPEALKFISWPLVVIVIFVPIKFTAPLIPSILLTIEAPLKALIIGFVEEPVIETLVPAVIVWTPEPPPPPPVSLEKSGVIEGGQQDILYFILYN